LNWDSEYSAWTQSGLTVDASYQFSNSGESAQANWNQPQTDAYNIGYAFAKHFGPTYGTGLVTSFEVRKYLHNTNANIKTTSQRY